VKKRSHYYDIAVALAESGFDFFGGGGLKDPTNKKGNSENFRGDARELIKNAGYQVINNKTDFMNLKKEDGKVLAINEWLQDHKALPFAMDMTKQDITLAEFTSKAIDMLENPNGFFLLVEGGKIDWACHANDAVAAITNTIAFDSAIQEAVRFAERFPEDTLIVVTGDHECGGLTLGFAGTKYATYFEILGNQNVSFQRFSDEILKTYKNGCQGDCRFDDLKPIISKHFGLRFAGDPETDMMVLKDYQVQMLREAYFRSMLDEKLTSKDPMTSLLYGGYEPLTIALTHLLNNKAGLGWTSYKHTGVPVSTSAMGVGAEIFNGYYDNADVAKKIMSVMGLEPKIYYALHEAPSRISARY
jgi:alkaline phosphatase